MEHIKLYIKTTIIVLYIFNWNIEQRNLICFLQIVGSSVTKRWIDFWRLHNFSLILVTDIATNDGDVREKIDQLSPKIINYGFHLTLTHLHLAVTDVLHKNKENEKIIYNKSREWKRIIVNMTKMRIFLILLTWR